MNQETSKKLLFSHRIGTERKPRNRKRKQIAFGAAGVLENINHRHVSDKVDGCKLRGGDP